jgi:hypothetical protein
VARYTTFFAGTQFLVPDQARARDLTDALAVYGFPSVEAAPYHDGGWQVLVSDGPYPSTRLGRRQRHAVARAAVRIAREHGGCAGLTWTGPPPLSGPGRLLRAVPAGTSSGSRPPMPRIEMRDPPPSVSLPLRPDRIDHRSADLSGVDDVGWADLDHAYHGLVDIPTMLRALADPASDWQDSRDELYQTLLHQGTCYPATTAAVPYIAGMVTGGGLGTHRRLGLCGWLLRAAGRRADELIGDADCAAARAHPPRSLPVTDEVHRAVGAQLPLLLDRWDVEPPAVRFVLACLAALYPSDGHRVVDGIAEIGQQYPRSVAGAYLHLASALVRRDDEQAMTLAADIVAWDDDASPAWLDAPGLPPALMAGQILANGGWSHSWSFG